VGTDVNHLADGSTVIDIDRPASPVGSQQVVINVPDVVGGSTSPLPPPSEVGTLPSHAAGSVTNVVDHVAGDTPAADVNVAVKSAPAGTAPPPAAKSTRRTANALNAVAEVWTRIT